MSRWFRFYDETLNDPKILKLSDNLYRIWVGLLCVASKNNGRLPDPNDLALLLRTTPVKIRSAVEKLMESGLIDEIDSDIVPHNWNGRQYKSDVSTERVKRFRNGQRNVSETPPDTDTDTDKNTRAPALVFETDWPKDYRDLFWQLYPRRQDKQAAFKKLDQIRRAGNVPWETFVAGVRRYAEFVRGKDQQFTKGPAAWLNAGKWDDELVPNNSIALPGGQRVEGWV